VADLKSAVARAQGAAKKKAEDAVPAKTKSDGTAPTPNEMMRRGAQAFLNALDNKEFVEALSKVDRAYNERMAGAFLRDLGLSPEQIDHMYDLMGKMMIAKMDANQAATAGGLDNESREALIVQTQQDISAQIQAYLGDQQFAAYQQFNREAGARSVAASLQNSLSFTSSPLSDAQAQQLTTAMFQTVPNGQNADATGVGALVPMNPNPAMSQVTQAELTAAQSILSAPQLAALQALYNSQQAMRKAQRSGGF